MPIDVQFDADLRLLVVTVAGSWPTPPEIVKERSRLLARGLLKPGMVELLDVRAVTNLPNATEMRTMLETVGTTPRKRAIVVTVDPQCNAGKFKFAESLDPRNMKVFREEPDARAWLLAPHQVDGDVEVDRTGTGRVPIVWNLGH